MRPLRREPLSALATSALATEVQLRDHESRWSGSRHFDPWTTAELRTEWNRRKRLRKRGADGKFLVPIRAPYGPEPLSKMIETSGSVVVAAWCRREDEPDEPGEWACVWCFDGVARSRDHPLCYDCRLVEAGERQPRAELRRRRRESVDLSIAKWLGENAGVEAREAFVAAQPPELRRELESLATIDEFEVLRRRALTLNE